MPSELRGSHVSNQPSASPIPFAVPTCSTVATEMPVGQAAPTGSGSLLSRGPSRGCETDRGVAAPRADGVRARSERAHMLCWQAVWTICARGPGARGSTTGRLAADEPERARTFRPSGGWSARLGLVALAAPFAAQVVLFIDQAHVVEGLMIERHRVGVAQLADARAKLLGDVLEGR